MNSGKYFNILCGLIYLGFGVFICLAPDRVSGFYSFGLQSLDAKTELRAIGGLNIGVGILFVYFALKARDQKPILFALAVLMVCIDGVDQPINIKELIFEMIVLMGAVWYLWRNKRLTEQL